jgi:hypothetical protein
LSHRLFAHRGLAGRVVDFNALRALAPPSLRPRSQAVRPPGPHAAAPLEPQAQED